jgi:hypothetical protein
MNMVENFMQISEEMAKKQIYFIETHSNFLKIVGLDNLIEFVRTLKKGEEIIVYYIGAIQKVIGKGN